MISKNNFTKRYSGGALWKSYERCLNINLDLVTLFTRYRNFRGVFYTRKHVPIVVIWFADDIRDKKKWHGQDLSSSSSLPRQMSCIGKTDLQHSVRATILEGQTIQENHFMIIPGQTNNKDRMEMQSKFRMSIKKKNVLRSTTLVL